VGWADGEIDGEMAGYQDSNEMDTKEWRRKSNIQK
jgi:hypothetical protein